ncbi:hypothetical protein ITJ38_07680 [Agreia pratensis]|uniref:Uncharacterized protein n=1 Tax=Agreia pratensis TaxID=150121 RepID=A0A1X7K912_9MICO|nr:hypothetical protein [Agreia pratensis]MBF4634276.1 hypothetical protein [Agreia pratensis]SMG36832.1 hypothetical protein SAMN06296010_2194 [Agreia pratensis]
MPAPRRKLSVFAWEPFLLGLVILAALAASMTVRLPVVGTVVGAISIAVALPAIVQLVRLGLKSGGERNSASRLARLDGFQLREVHVDGVLMLDETNRRQDPIDLALGWTDPALTVVLWPGATRWLGRELRVEAYFFGGPKPARAGFLPRGTEASIGEALEKLRDEGVLATVPARVFGDGKLPDPSRPFTRLARPLTVEVGRPADGAIDAIRP